jgi:hypothetical protein
MESSIGSTENSLSLDGSPTKKKKKRKFAHLYKKAALSPL